MNSSLRTFLRFLDDPKPGFVLQEESFPEDVEHCPVHHLPGPPVDDGARRILDELLARSKEFDDFRAFYSSTNGADICRARSLNDDGETEPSVQLLPVERWREFTAEFLPDGSLAWTIDLNRYKKVPGLYREGTDWIAFARVGDIGALTTLLNGPSTGEIFFLTPEPKWNIARYLAKDFANLSAKMSLDLVAVLRRLQVTSPDGLRIHQYVADRGASLETQPPTHPS